MTMRVKSLLIVVVILLVGLLGVGAVAADTVTSLDVTVETGGDENIYTPDDVTIAVGDTVTWTNVGGFHNVVAYDGSFGNGGATTPTGSNWPYSYTFTTPGVYTYYCTPHESEGMTGTIRVEGPAAVSLGAFRLQEEVQPTVPYALFGSVAAGVALLAGGVFIAKRRTDAE